MLSTVVNDLLPYFMQHYYSMFINFVVFIAIKLTQVRLDIIIIGVSYTIQELFANNEVNGNLSNKEKDYIVDVATHPASFQ